MIYHINRYRMEAIKFEIPTYVYIPATTYQPGVYLVRTTFVETYCALQKHAKRQTAQ